MRHRAFVPAVVALVGMTVCAVVLSRWSAQRHEIAWLQKQLAFTRLAEHRLSHQLARERHRRLAGLVARLHQPVGEEIPHILRQVPQHVTVQSMTATPEHWMIAIVPHDAHPNGQAQTITFARLNGARQ